MSDMNECDVSVVLGTIVVFALPLTLLVPGFSVWDVLPKVRITRFHIISQNITWSQINAAVITLLAVLFCLYLEIRKRNLDDMVENVLTVSQTTETAMEVERERQTAAAKVCLDMIDASVEHYEHLALLRDDLRQRDNPSKQHPPAIEISSSDL